MHTCCQSQWQSQCIDAAGSIFSVKSFKLVPISFLRDITFYAIAASWVFYLFIIPRHITLYDGVGTSISSHIYPHLLSLPRVAVVLRLIP